jgi:amino acid adenylation domain-containing protein
MGRIKRMSEEHRHRTIASSSPGRVFVQIPTDHLASSAAEHQEARVYVVNPAPAASAGPTDFLAVLTAVLYRHTQQPAIAIDAYFGSADVKAALYPAVAGGHSFAALAADIGGVLGAAGRDKTGAPAAGPSLGDSNVAATFVTGPLEPAELAIRYRTRSRRYDLHFIVQETAALRAVVVLYNARLLNAVTVERWVDSLFVLSAEAMADRPALIRNLPVLNPVTTRRILKDWDSGTAHYPDLAVHRCFERLAAGQPEAPAVHFQGLSLSYGQLEQGSNRLAQFLVSAGVTPGSRVAVCVQPGPEILLSLLAIWKAGAVYVPLDPGHPAAFVAAILSEAAPRLVLTQSKFRDLTQADQADQADQVRHFCFDRPDDRADVDARPATAPDVALGLEAGATLLYTSGTTGKPKGVVATHANLAHYVNVAQQRYGFRSDDVFCSLARYTFSISLFELVSPLCCGGSVHLLERDAVLSPDRLARALQPVTVVHAGPSLLGTLFRYLRSNPSAPGSFPRMRHASSGGDLVPPHLQEEMKVVFDRAELFVIYGCTEISCMGATFAIPRSDKVARSFVGKPFPDVTIRLLDADGNLVPLGAVGEICFSGRGVVPGYLERPQLTAEKFVAREGTTYYHTGDLGRLHADGNLEILGRRDFQVQLRGIRIELAGIENTIRELGLAVQCAVVMRAFDEQDVRLVAFVVAPREPGVAVFRRALGQQLPDYMLPQHVVVLDEMPLTANGKLDRNRLQQFPLDLAALSISTHAHAGGAGAGPRNPIEKKIAAAFARCLGVEKVAIDDDFFSLGGHSLLAVTVTQELENSLGLTLPPGTLFEHPTVRGLAQLAQNPAASVPRPILLSASAQGPALFMIAGVHLYRRLAQQLEGAYSVYGVYASTELVLFEAGAPPPPIAELAREYVQIIRRQQPAGPYRLAGISFGGILVFEVAQQLRAAGEKVVFLGLLDAILPEPGADGRAIKLRRLLGLSSHELYRFVAKRLRARADAWLAPGRKARFARHVGDEKLSPLEVLREGAYDLAANAYVRDVRPYPGAVTLVVARRRQVDDLGSADCGWKAQAPQLAIHRVDCDHLALLEEPKVAEVAQIFRAALDGVPNRRPLPAARPGGPDPAFDPCIAP